MTVFSLYGRIWRTYFAWAGTLLPLACFVFVPLGLVHAIPVHVDATTIDLDGGIELVGAGAALLLLVATGLLGEIFYTGAVAIALTRPDHDKPSSLREVAGAIRYGTLIAVDLIFGGLVAVGVLAFFVPGFLFFVFLGLAAPVVEIEHHGVRAALVRSYRLVRGHFWLVAAVLVPIEIVSDAVTSGGTGLSHSLLGDSLLVEWLTDTLSNIVLTPFYAVAAVLLATDMSAEKDGAATQLHSQPLSR
jgi:hypothetical protein